MNRFYKLCLGVVAVLLMSSCEDFKDDNLDFSNSFAQYVEFSSGSAVAGEAGAQAEITVRMRETLNVPVTVDYDISGDISNSGSVMIEKGALSASIAVTIPMSPASGTAQIKLTGVDNGLSLGRGGPDAGLSPVSRDLGW